MKKRILASLLSLCLLVGLLPTAALAIDEESGGDPSPNCTMTEGCTLEDGHEGECTLPGDAVPAEGDELELLANDTMSGNCGADGNESNVTWSLEMNNDDVDNPTYTLTISGEGAMKDYTWNDDTRPWMRYQYRCLGVCLCKKSQGNRHCGERHCLRHVLPGGM